MRYPLEIKHDTATYQGHLVSVTGRRKVPGGVAVDIAKHPMEKNWPWKVKQFTTAESNIVYPKERKDRLPRIKAKIEEDPEASWLCQIGTFLEDEEGVLPQCIWEFHIHLRGDAMQGGLVIFKKFPGSPLKPDAIHLVAEVFVRLLNGDLVRLTKNNPLFLSQWMRIRDDLC